MQLLDSLVNLVSRLGTSSDKGTHSEYVDEILTAQQIITAYRVSGVVRTIVDRPAREAVRAWREWQATADEISAIELVEKKLGLRIKWRNSIRRARLMGGGAIYIGTGDQNLELPLDPFKMKKGGLQFLTVLSRNQLTAGPMVTDPSLEGFGQPEYFTLARYSGSPRVHPTRLAIFRGPDVPDEDITQAMGYWGDSVLNAVLSAVKRVDSTAGNMASLVFEAKIDVIKIPGLLDRLAGPDGDKFERLVQRRVALSNTAKSSVNALLMDTSEEFEQREYSFTGLPQVAETMMTLVSAETGIPATLLWGKSPDGMNATGESDRDNWEDLISSVQEESAEAASILDQCIIASALGSVPDEVHFNWRPLQQMTSEERAEVGSKNSEMLTRIVEMGLIPEEAMQRVVVNVMTESGAMPGFEGAVADYYEEHPDEEGDLVGLAEEPEEEPKLRVVGDMAPRTMYVRRDVLNAEDILAHYREQGITGLEPAEELHVTIIYSRTPVDWMTMGETWDDAIEIREGGPRASDLFGLERDYLVLQFASSSLEWRHSDMLRLGASSDHPKYQPHITIAHGPDVAYQDPEKIEPYRGIIRLGPEIFEPVKE